MRAGGYNLGGEQSGHIVMTDYTTTVCKRFDPVPQVLKSVATNGGSPLDDEKVAAVIEKNRLRLGNEGRLLIRASGTEPVVRVMAEGDDETLVVSVVGDIVEALQAASAHP
jgi:phosphoglucosamine mutase